MDSSTTGILYPLLPFCSLQKLLVRDAQVTTFPGSMFLKSERALDDNDASLSLSQDATGSSYPQ